MLSKDSTASVEVGARLPWSLEQGALWAPE